MKKTHTKENVMAYLSSWLNVPLKDLKDDMVVGNIDGVGEVCCCTFGKKIVVYDVNTFTIGDLVRQLTASDID